MGVAISVVVTNVIAKIVKIIYIGTKVEIKPMTVIGLIFSSWRFGLVILPVCIVSYSLLPRTWGGEILMAAIFTVISAIVFLLMPKFVGKQYEDEVYVKVKAFVYDKLHK